MTRARSNPINHSYALGRLKAGAMNKTEAAYAQHLDLLKIAGEVLWWKFEGLKFRLADNTFYTPDFAVMVADGFIELHEVKGSPRIFQDDAKVKIKVASALYPFRFYAVFPRAKGVGGGWDVVDYSGAAGEQ
jgi:hypothetical protein